jgi:hypothetical protein
MFRPKCGSKHAAIYCKDIVVVVVIIIIIIINTGSRQLHNDLCAVQDDRASDIQLA